MEKVSNFFVKKRYLIFGAMMVFLVGCLIAIPFVNTTNDFASFLPEDSSMRQGLAIMDEQWPADDEPANRSFVIMTLNATDGQTEALRVFAVGLDEISGVTYEFNNPNFNVDHYRLMIFRTNQTTISGARDVMRRVEDHLNSQNISFYSDLPGALDPIMDFMLPIAVALMILVLFIMCESWFDPILIFMGLGAAVVFNMGTNIIFPTVGEMTTSVASVMQLMLSIVCTLILLTRYNQEKKLLPDKDPKLAMKNAIKNSTKTILSACIATFIGLLSLLLMSFGIGQEMGLVFSKGVFFTVVSLYTVMPTIIIWCDKILEKTNKANIKQRRLARKETSNNVDTFEV